MSRIIFLMVLTFVLICDNSSSISENLETYPDEVYNEVAELEPSQTQTPETKVQESFKTYINYLVRKGDTLDSISKKFQLTPKDITDLNGLSENTEMIPGQFLKIPLQVKKPQVETVRRPEQKELNISPTEKPVVKSVIEDQEDTVSKANEEENDTVSEGQKEGYEAPTDSRATVEDDVVNLQTEMDLKDLIQTISELTGETFLMDDTVKGKKVTIITPQGGFKKENSLRLFETILDINGFSIVKKDGINKIIQKRDIKTESIPTEFGTSFKGSSDRFITRLVPLDNIPANEVANLLKPLISRDGDVAVYPDLNTLIIVESESNINRLLTIIENIDLKKEIQFIKIEYSDAAEVAAKLIDILGGAGSVTSSTAPAAPPARRAARGDRDNERTPQTQAVRPVSAGGQSSIPGFRVIVDERTNSLIVIAYPEDIPKINALI
ncbi:MAG: secretin N-terminal domain-containing protein, partial [Thermodesulfobacteriota bacterium]